MPHRFCEAIAVLSSRNTWLFAISANTYHVRVRNRRRGVTFVEVIVATAFVGICAGTLADSVVFSNSTISYIQRRALVQAKLQSIIDEVRSNALVVLPSDSTSSSNFTLPGSRTVTVAKSLTKISGKNVTKLLLTATWPESKGSRNFTDNLSFELYVRGPDN